MDSSSEEDEGTYINPAVVETDSSGRYVRYNHLLGEGGIKEVYKGFDTDNGVEVAWSKIDLTEEILKNKIYLESLCSADASLLMSLQHENIVRFHRSWVDFDDRIINMITEVFSSGSLVQYLKKHTSVHDKAIKNWCRQILQGLVYLHSHSPPIVHRDVKCENIFVNGETGSVKLGGFDLAMTLEQESTEEKHGSPQFMAPEFIEGHYNHLVDIYAFGMCVLQMVTGETPYRECRNAIHIRSKVRSGVMPVALSEVEDPGFKQFIEKCLVPASERPAAIDLLSDPFLAPSVSDTLTASSSLSLRESVREYVREQVAILLPDKKFRLRGKKNDNVSILMTLWITRELNVRKIQIEFLLEHDTTEVVMQKIATENGLSTGEVTLLSGLMEQLITALKSSDCPLKELLEISSDNREVRRTFRTTTTYLEHRDMQTY